jgi:DNA invertase Pin-like site-specific DNA recombinase
LSRPRQRVAKALSFHRRYRPIERDLIRGRTTAGLDAARARGRHGSRPSVMTTHKVQMAEEMYRSGQYSVVAIASTLGVSRASIYRHLNRADA